MKPVVFDSEANEEYRDAASWYEARRDGLGEEFTAEIEQASQRIAQMPQSFPPHDSAGMRRCVLRRFPYTIFFLELDDRIWIAAVAHHKRRPGYWDHRRPN